MFLSIYIGIDLRSKRPGVNVFWNNEILLNFLKQLKLICNISFNRNEKKLAVRRKMAKILTVSRRSHHPIETLFFERSRYIGHDVLFWRAQTTSFIESAPCLLLKARLTSLVTCKTTYPWLGTT